MNRNKIFKKVLKVIVIVAVAFTAFTSVVMLLWNNVLSVVLNISQVTFWQAAGILLLSKILFGGFGRGGWGKDKRDFRMKMKEKWSNMSPEERERFKQQWKDRCGGRWGRRDFFQTESQAEHKED